MAIPTHEQIVNGMRGTSTAVPPHQEIESGLFSRRNVQAATSAVTDLAGRGARTAGSFLSEQTRNLVDTLRGRLPVRREDIQEGIFDTVEGIAKAGKFVAQETFGGLSRIGKTALRAVGLPEFDSPEVEKKVFGSETQPVQESAKRFGNLLEEYGATPAEKKAGMGLFVVGAIALDLPGGSAGKKPIKGILEELAKATDEAVVRNTIEREFPQLPQELRSSISSRIATEAQTPDQVRRVFAEEADTLAQRVRQSVAEEQALLRGTEPAVVGDGVERGFVTSVRQLNPELAQRVAGQYIPRSTDALARQARQLIEDNVDEAVSVALRGTDDLSVATASELIKLYNEKALAATSKAEANAFFDKAADITNQVAPKLTELGRAVQAASILGRMTPEGVIRTAARVIKNYNDEVDRTAGGILGTRKKLPELSGKKAGEFARRAKRIQEMPDGTEKAMETRKLQDDIAGLVPSPWWKKAVTIWKAGLLTGLRTSGLNTLSNLFHGVSEFAKDVPAVAVDSMASLLTGKRTLALTGRGSVSGIREGVKKGWRYLKTGFDERDVAKKLDLKKVNFGNSPVAKALQTYEEFVFRVIGAQDQPFYYGAKARSLYSQAIAEAKNQKLRGRKFEEFIESAVQNPTDEMLRHAVNDAEIAVFMNRTILSDAAHKIQQIPGGEFVLPFARTPSSVAMQLINYSPVGIVKTIVENIGKGRFNQRAFSQGIGRGITGTAILYIGMKLYEKGMITLERPGTEGERAQQQLEGSRELAVKIGDRWRAVNVLGPVGNVLVVGGILQRGLNETGSLAGALVQAGLGGVKSLTDQTFLRGLDQFIQALMNPEQYAETYAAGLIGSTVPTIVSDVAQATDPLQRRTRPSQDGLTARLQSRVPGLRQELEPQVDVLGRPVERAGNALETLIDPTRPTRIKSTELIEELKRLAEAGYHATPTEFNEKYMGVLTPEEKTVLMERAGEVLEEKLTKLVQVEGYQKLSDEEKQRLIRSFADKARVDARAEVVVQKIQGLQGEARTEQLRQLKESGFMTKEVFNRAARMF